MVVPYGIGDAMILCGLKRHIEDRYGAEVVPVIKPSQEIVPKLYGITNYELQAFGNNELRQMAEFVKEPAPGKMFVAHPAFGKEQLNESFLNHRLSFVDMLCEHYGIEHGLRIDFPVYCPELKGELRRKLGYTDYKDIILLAPEMKSASDSERIQDNLFLKMISEYEDKGYKVVVNCDAHSDVYKGYAVDLSLEELVFLGCNAEKVISSRSGFCDLIYGFAADLDILYPNKAFFDLFEMKKIFAKENTRVSESVLSIAGELRRLGYGSAAIYGYGNVGKRVRYSLQAENFDVQYVIDRNEICEKGIDSFSIDQKLPQVDVVLVSIPDDGDIACKLNSYGLNTLFLKDLMKGANL
jgi:hypothetical protein